MNQRSSSAEFVLSLARGLDVIRSFDDDAPEMTLSQVAKRTNMPRAAARRFLHTLRTLGYVASDGRNFRLTPQVLSLGYAFLSSMTIWEVAQPFMEEVSQQVHESCSMSVLEGNDIVYVARVPTKRIMSVALGIGTRLPAHCTSMGRVLLANLPADALDDYFSTSDRRAYTKGTVTDEAALRAILDQVREQQYALIDQELELGVRSIAVPLHDKGGRVLAGLNASGHAARVTSQEMERDFLPHLRHATAEITALLPR